MTEKERFILKCQEHFTQPHWDTKKAFEMLSVDGDLTHFLVRELGSRTDYFSDEQEADLALFIERMLNTYIFTRLRLHRIDFTILTLKLLLTLADDIQEYQYYKGLIQEVPLEQQPGFYTDYDQE